MLGKLAKRGNMLKQVQHDKESGLLRAYSFTAVIIRFLPAVEMTRKGVDYGKEVEGF
jgi:hypothetical protein